MKRNLSYILLGTAAVLAAATGFFVSQAFSQGSQTPERTVTINLANGPTGPTGPQGPPGPAGEANCPAPYKLTDLVINHPGGQVTILTCAK